jgi:hypothetical protein
MRAPMRFRHVVLLVLLLGCGKEVGDACVVNADCSPNGDRICLAQDNSDKGGYCTVAGCDFSTCPEESVCVRFFNGNFSNKPCVMPTDCSLDEICGLEGNCVPRSSEIRFCMRKCSGDGQGDCRDGYECRNKELMMEHGGEPVLDTDIPDRDNDNLPKFCAPAPA